MRHGIGVHLPNGPGDLDRWLDTIGDGCYTLLHYERGWLPRIRQKCPHALILVRFYLVNWYATDPAAWARECADIYRRDIQPYTRRITWANEQNLAHESGGAIGALPERLATRGDYETIHRWNTQWLDAWSRESGVEDAILHYPAFASGHSDDQDDYGFIGLDVCRPSVNRTHVLDRHYYWKVDKPILDLHLGVRRIQLAHQLFPNKPILVKESGNFAVTDPRSPEQYAFAASYFAKLPYCLGSTPFIAEDPTGHHRDNDISRNAQVVDALRTVPRISKVESEWGKLSMAGNITLSVPHKTILTPNYYAGGLTKPIGIFLHATRGPGDRTLEKEYQSARDYMLTPDTTSAHMLLGPSEVTRLVNDVDRAWHAEENNHTHLSMEVAQPSSLPNFTDFQYRAAAEITRKWCDKHSIPKVRVMSQTQRGIIGHEDSEQGKRHGKSDPGAKWNWEYFLSLVNGTATQPDPDPLDGKVRVGDKVYDVGIGFEKFLRDNPDVGSPRHDVQYTHYGDAYLYLTASPKYKRGAVLFWWKWLNAVQLVSRESL